LAVPRRPAAQDVLDVLPHRLPVGIPIGGILRHRARDHVLHVGGQIGDEIAQRFRMLVRDAREDARHVRGLERRAPREQEIGDGAQREQVRASVHGLAQRLFRRHVEGRAEELAGRGELARLELGDAEVHDLRLAGGDEHDVRGLDVAVDDPSRMRVVHGVGQAADDA
jgi:hypothetical protein